MYRLITASCLLATLGVLSGCASTPSEDDPVNVKLNDLDARTARIEKVVSNQSLLDLSQHVDLLQAQIRLLRGRIDELENENATLRKQQRDLYNDLDKRISQLSGSSGAAAGAGAAAAGAATGASAEQALYAQGIDALKAAKYPVAISSFHEFLTRYPKSDLADNAEYWLGEAYYVTRDFQSAATAFRTVGDQWPNSHKAPDALLKLGYSQYELKQYAAARATLTEVTRRFPDTSAAKLASERMRRMTPAESGGGASDAESGAGAAAKPQTGSPPGAAAGAAVGGTAAACASGSGSGAGAPALACRG